MRILVVHHRPGQAPVTVSNTPLQVDEQRQRLDVLLDRGPSSTRLLTDSAAGSGRPVRGATRSRSASRASTSAAQSSAPSAGALEPSRPSRGAPGPPRDPRHRGAPQPDRLAYTASIALSRNGFGSPSAGAGAQSLDHAARLAGVGRFVDDLLEFAEELRRSPCGFALGGAPVMTRQQKRGSPCG